MKSFRNIEDEYLAALDGYHTRVSHMPTVLIVASVTYNLDIQGRIIYIISSRSLKLTLSNKTKQTVNISNNNDT